MHRRNASETGCSVTSQAGKPAPRRCAWHLFARCRHPRSYYVKPEDNIRISTNCHEPSISLMNDRVPSFSPPGNEAFHRVPVWPPSDMLHCVPILSVKDVARSTLHAPRSTLHGLHCVPILPLKDVAPHLAVTPTPRHAVSTLHVLHGIEVFYPVPIVINRRKRKNPTETPTLRLAGTPTPRHALSTHRAISESIA